MNFEYLLFNIVIISGPLSLSFDKKVHFVGKWKRVFKAILGPMLVFIIWDAMVTNKHWWFNERFVLNIRLLGLPVEEWLFFITVPFSSLFIWECLAAYLPNRKLLKFRFLRPVLLLSVLPGGMLFLSGKEYTGLVLVAMGLVAFLDVVLQTDLFFHLRTYQYLAILMGLMLLFNGYLTTRPVVLYNEVYQLGFRIFTIPIEDFVYGFSHLILCTIFYEKINEVKINELKIN